MWVRSNEPRTANRERNKRRHAKRGNISMVVANVTALQRHWPILVKQKADWLALTEVGVRQREIPVMQAQLLSSDNDSEWRKPLRARMSVEE